MGIPVLDVLSEFFDLSAKAVYFGTESLAILLLVG